MVTVNLPGKMGTSALAIRILAGLLVVAALGLGAKAIWFDQTRYLVAHRVVPIGANLAHEKWDEVGISLGKLAGSYLQGGKTPTGFAQATIGAGQLVPLSAVGKRAPETRARLVLTNKTALGSGVRSGAEVSIWSTRRISAGVLDAPRRLVAKATVARIIKGGEVFGGQSQQVEVLVTPMQAPLLLEAMASESPIFLVAGQ